MIYGVLALFVLFLLPIFVLWRKHVKGFYALEESLERRVGPVRDFYEGVGYYSISSSGMIPMLNQLRERFGDSFTPEEELMERNSRRFYYIGGSLVLVGFTSIVSFVFFSL